MRPTTIIALIGALLLTIALQAWAATTTNVAFDVQGLPRINVTVDAATTGDVVATDTGALGGGSKRATILRVVSNAQTKFILQRFQVAGNGVWVDSIAAETTTALASRIGTFNLATAAPGHPSPTHDAVDDAVSALMVGYTGS